MSLEIHEDKSSQFCILYTFLWILMLKKDLVNFLTIPLQKKKIMLNFVGIGPVVQN